MTPKKKIKQENMVKNSLFDHDFCSNIIVSMLYIVTKTNFISHLTIRLSRSKNNNPLIKIVVMMDVLVRALIMKSKLDISFCRTSPVSIRL